MSWRQNDVYWVPYTKKLLIYEIRKHYGDEVNISELNRMKKKQLIAIFHSIRERKINDIMTEIIKGKI